MMVAGRDAIDDAEDAAKQNLDSIAVMEVGAHVCSQKGIEG